MSKEWLEKKLRNEYRRQSGKTNSIKLSENISYEHDERRLFLVLDENCVTANMQKDEAAFEGWVLALRWWLKSEYKNIILRWKSPDASCSKQKQQHYQRFLYRIIKFKELFPSWFHVEGPYEKCRIQYDNGPFVLNAPKEYRSSEIKGKNNSEHYIECMFCGKWRPCLAQAIGITERSIDSQLPVGLFDGKVEYETAIFPCKKSAIDLWAVHGSSLHIFELKTKRNSKIGIISELFCYAMMMKDACQNIFTWQEDGNGRLIPRKLIGRNIKKIQAHFLAPSLHPLIDAEMIGFLNQSLCDKELSVQFDFLQFSNKNDENPDIHKVW